MRAGHLGGLGGAIGARDAAPCPRARTITGCRTEAPPACAAPLWCRYFLWPNLVLDVYPEQTVVTQILPLGTRETMVRETAYALPDATRGVRLARYLNQRVRRRIAANDRRLVERVQAGLDTGDYQPGPLAADDTGLRWHGRLAAEFRPRLRSCQSAQPAERREP